MGRKIAVQYTNDLRGSVKTESWGPFVLLKAGSV